MRFLLLILAALIPIACSEPGSVSSTDTVEPTAGQDPRPNIVLIVFEDLSPRFGAYGDDIAKTPNFDRIAAESVLYTRTFTAAGVCAPSRAALITGRHQQTIGAQHMRTTGYGGVPGGGPQNYLAVPPPSVRAFPELLRAAGYHATNDFKTDYQFGEPFTVWDESRPGADWSTRESDQPFFAMITLLTTHESGIWPIDVEPSTPLESAVVANNQRVFADRQAVTDPASVVVPPYLPDVPEVRRDLATHYDNIAFTDARLGEIFDRLATEGLLDDTIVIVTTDHGDGLPRMKRSLYDGGLHVPMLIRYPDGFGAGTINDELISFVDLAPTILDWARVEAPSWMHGRDFAGPDRDEPRSYIFAGQDRTDNVMNHRRAIRDGRYKYIRNYRPDDAYFRPLAFRDAQPTMKALWAAREDGTLSAEGLALFDPLPEHQLYDTDNDPHEVNNLAEDPEFSGILISMQDALEAWRGRVGDMSELSEASMIDVMWPGGVQPVTAAPEVTRDGGSIVLSSATDGTSLGYRYADDPEGRWRLYVDPFKPRGDVAIQVKAIRYGYAESRETLIEPLSSSP
ncbi:MAG: sulfatase [Pseudomonadota bacterium]